LITQTATVPSVVVHIPHNFSFHNHTLACTFAKYFYVERFVIQKQRGLCRHCGEGFVRTDIVVSRGRSNRKCYHRQCGSAEHHLNKFGNVAAFRVLKDIDDYNRIGGMKN